jgi:hypothetical protein
VDLAHVALPGVGRGKPGLGLQRGGNDVAVRQDDDDKIDKILEEIDKFNTKNAMLAINGETVSKSLQSRAERRGKAYQGLSVSDKEAPFVYPLVEGTRSSQYK